MDFMSKIRSIKSALAAVLLVLAGAFAFADKTPVANLYQYELDNGLTLFVNENHNVPLAYIEIAVKAGATTQTPETAGLFHLYEHMMFKGNELYPDAASVQKAISDLGVADWNGTTGIDHVNYFFTVPSYELESGLAFWNAAVRTPTMDPAELENEKKVVLAEIEGELSEPISGFYGYMDKTLFADAPYRMSPGGAPATVSNATVAQMKDMQSKYYIPANSALFVGGDVNPDEVYALVNKIYGDWSNNGNEAPKAAPQISKNPLQNVEYAVLPYDQMSPYYADVEIIWRGPDTDYDLNDTYAADYLVNLFGDPAGKFKTSLSNNEALGIPDVDYVWGSYGTTRGTSYFDFGAYMLSPEQSLVERADMLLSEVTKSVNEVANDKSQFASSKVKKIVTKINDDNTRNAETATGMLSNLRFWWTVTNPEYYYTYANTLGKVKQKEAQAFVNKYINETKPLVVVLVNPEIYELTKDEYLAKGYKELSAEDAKWWDLPQCQPNADVIASQIGTVEQSAPIYKPTKAEKVEYNSNVKVEEYKLANGIPVYVQKQNGAKVDSIYVAVKGGIQHLTKETSGLESTLFTMMSKSSKKYPLAARQSKTFDTGASINSFNKIVGSALSLTVLDNYFYDVLPMLTDGFINPDYDETVYTNTMNDIKQSIQSMLNDPFSLLQYETSKAVYAGHPYEVKTSATLDSVENITIENMKALHEKILDSRQMVIVAAGNIDGKKLVKELNKTIGKIAAGKDALPEAQEIPPVTIPSGDPILLTHSSAAGTGHVIRVFESPSPLSSEFIPAYLAGEIYSGIMFNVVREHNGACYTPWSNIGSSFAPYGIEALFKISNPNFAEYMSDARDYMMNNKIIEGLDENGNYIFTTINNRLEGYVNSYITSTYESMATTSEIAGEYLYNIVQYNDINHDAVFMDKVLNTTEEEILDAFKKYWIESPSQWFYITGPGEETGVKF